MTVNIVTPAGVTARVPPLGPLVAGYGATYASAGMHDVYVYGGAYASTHVERLNGNQNYRVDLILLPVPIVSATGGRGSTTNTTQLRTFMAKQVQLQIWTEEEMSGVASMLSLVSYARTRPSPDSQLRDLITTVAGALEGLGIDA